MKAFGCILISALAIYTLVPTSGYEVQPLYGRTFNLFNLLTSPQALLTRLTSLTSRFAILQSTVDILSSQFAALQAIVASLQAQIAALQAPKCPFTASGGKVISGKCYTVTTVSSGITWTAAKTACTSGFGILAEPTPTVAASKSFYSTFKLNFPTQFTTIEASSTPEIWIGYVQGAVSATADLIAVSGSGLFAPLSAGSILSNSLPITPIPTKPLAAAIVGPTGTSWFASDSTTVLRPAYICQYNTA